jgi:hypothetical protein
MIEKTHEFSFYFSRVLVLWTRAFTLFMAIDARSPTYGVSKFLSPVDGLCYV